MVSILAPNLLAPIAVALYSYMSLVPIIQPPIMRVLDTVAGLGFGKMLCLITRGKVNPLIGASGIFAFPVSARVVNRIGLEANPNNFLIMHATGSNTAGQIASVMAGGAVLALLAR